MKTQECCKATNWHVGSKYELSFLLSKSGNDPLLMQKVTITSKKKQKPKTASEPMSRCQQSFFISFEATRPSMLPSSGHRST